MKYIILLGFIYSIGCTCENAGDRFTKSLCKTDKFINHKSCEKYKDK